jgi:hypothetical protein
MDELQARINKLGDISRLIGEIFKRQGPNFKSEGCWNPAAFTTAHIGEPFGWDIPELPKPTLEELERIKRRLDASLFEKFVNLFTGEF